MLPSYNLFNILYILGLILLPKCCETEFQRAEIAENDPIIVKSSGEMMINLQKLNSEPELQTTETPSEVFARLPDVVSEPVCPGDVNPVYPLCPNIRGELHHAKFTNNSVCVFNKPEQFTAKIAISKTFAFGLLAAWGIMG